MGYCQKDVLLSGAIDCSRVAKAVFTYRVAHPDGTPEPLATLFTGDKLDCTECLNTLRMTAWARGQARAQGLKPDVSACVGPRFVAGFQAKPYPHRIKEAYDAAVAACKR